jgi:hypothetical protein
MAGHGFVGRQAVLRGILGGGCMEGSFLEEGEGRRRGEEKFTKCELQSRKKKV